LGRTYKATGINLKGMALGETDKLLTILTREHGLVRAVAAGARKHRSSLAGRSGLFVVNDLAIACGRNLDRITQAETVHSFLGLSQNLAKLTAAQYLIELTLIQALTAQPQEELFLVIVEHLLRLNNAAADLRTVMALLNHGIYHLLAVAGLAPQVHQCCISRLVIQTGTQSKVQAENQPGAIANGGDRLPRSGQKFGFSIANGGVVILDPEFSPNITNNADHLYSNSLNNFNNFFDNSGNLDQNSDKLDLDSDRDQYVEYGGLELDKYLDIYTEDMQDLSDRPNRSRSPNADHDRSTIKSKPNQLNEIKSQERNLQISHNLNHAELEALQLLTQAEFTSSILHLDTSVWLSIERILRAYTKYHFDKPIQSADLIDSCFNTL
jgi:DNA repair protein RecO (recombination protein O)